MPADRTRLEGFVLISAEPEASAAFYAWLLNAAALRDCGVLAVESAHTEGPGASWVPVFRVADGLVTDSTVTSPDGQLWSYVVDEDEIWTAVVHQTTGLPGPGRSNVDYLSDDTAATAARYGQALGLDPWAVVDDPYDFHLLVGDGRAAAGVVRFRTTAHISAPRGWLVYHDVPDIAHAVGRALEANCRLVVPIANSPFNRFAVLLDPYGTPFGLSESTAEEDPAHVKVRHADGTIAAADEVFHVLF
jgi:predicted enzyme related to lactoylglutathione lyase